MQSEGALRWESAEFKIRKDVPGTNVPEPYTQQQQDAHDHYKALHKKAAAMYDLIDLKEYEMAKLAAAMLMSHIVENGLLSEEQRRDALDARHLETFIAE